MKEKTKILSFGHIPSWAGGKQETGLANVIFQLAHKMAAEDQDVFEVRLVATDMHSDSDAFAPLYIYGWTKPLLIRHILRYPLQALRLLLHLRRCRQTYGEVENTQFAAVHARQEESVQHTFAVSGAARAKYIKVTARNFGPLPDWHVSAGQQAWVFVDEIIVK